MALQDLTRRKRLLVNRTPPHVEAIILDLFAGATGVWSGTDMDGWVASYNEQRPHESRWCFGKTPMQTFVDATALAKGKMIAA